MPFTGQPGTSTSQPVQVVPMYGAGGTKRSKSLSGTLTSSGLLSTIRTFTFSQLSITAYRAVFRGISFLTNYRLVILKDTPVAYWRLDDAASPVLDSSGNNNSGTMVGGVTPRVAGATMDGNQGMTFNGSTGYITIPTTPMLHPGDTFSLELWLKTTTSLGSDLLDGGLTDYEITLLSGGKLRFAKSQTQLIQDSIATYNDGLWHHVVWTKAQTTNHFYVDGVEITTAPANATIVATANPVRLANGGGGFFAGSLDEVALYNYALSFTQILNHYNVATQNQGRFITVQRTI